MTFHQQLVLKNWMPRFFRGDDLQKLKERLGDDRYERIEGGHTLFFGQFTADGFVFLNLPDNAATQKNLHLGI